MEIRGVEPHVVKAAAEKILAKCERWRTTKHGIAFVLRPDVGCAYRALSPSGRRVNALCFHGHKRFMDLIFKLNVGATIITTLARYNGREDFESKWRNLDPRKGFQSTFNCAHGG